MAEKKPKQEIVPIEDRRVAERVHTGRLYPRQDASLAECPTSLDLTSDNGKMLALNAGNPGDIEIGKEGYVIVEAHAFLIVPDEQVDEETGELHQFVRTILFERDGRTFRTTAAHAPHRIAATIDLYPRAFIDHPIRYIIRNRLGKRGRMYHDIRLAPQTKE